MAEGRLVFLTGATGFIGSRLARRLAERGDRLRCLVRPTSDTADLERLGAELIVGDTTDGAALARGMAGADLAYHLAGIFEVGVVDAHALEQANIEGTRKFLSAVERTGTRAVHVSTTVALAPVASGEGDERTEHPPGARHPAVYNRTKTKAHRLARDAQQRRGLPLIIACPAFVYGPGDRGPAGQLIEDLLSRRLPGLLARPAWFSFVHVDDVAAGLELAGEKGKVGEVYVLSGEHRPLNDFVIEAARIARRRPPLLRFPVPFAWTTGVLLDLVSRATGIRFPITREGVSLAAGKRWLHSHAKAKRELGWTPRPLAEGLPETVAWYRDRRAARRRR